MLPAAVCCMRVGRLVNSDVSSHGVHVQVLSAVDKEQLFGSPQFEVFSI